MQNFTWVAIAFAALAGCSSSKGTDGVVLNGRCRCDGDATCVQQVAAGAANPVACVTSAFAGVGCAQFANSLRSCWPSATVAGLCLCNGGEALANAHASR